MTAPIIQIKNLTKRFGSRTIIDSINLDIHPGEIVCFIGPSGTGKSTLLRCVNGLEDIQGGDILFDNKRVDSRSKSIVEIRKRVGMIFQHFNLYPHLTALENVALAPVIVHGEDEKTVRKRALELFEKVRLSHRVNAYPSQLSGGEQQRVAIARALITNPRLLVFDEPTSALDPETVGEVLGVMRALAQEGRTMMVVTHEIRFAADVGTRMIFMDQGKIIEDRNPREMLANPQTDRAKQFLQTIQI